MSSIRRSLISCCYKGERDQVITHQVEPNPVIAHKGITNLGGTGYMSWTIHLLYYMSPIRKAIYQENRSPEPIGDKAITKSDSYDLEPSPTNIALALQQIFSELQFGKKAASVESLAEFISYRCDIHDGEFYQRVKGFYRTTIHRLRDVSAINDCFFWNLEDLLTCEQLDYESRRAHFEECLDVRVLGISSLQKSLDNYFGIKNLRTDVNRNGIERGVRVLELPVLAVIQLRRFLSNPANSDRVEKVLDKFEFPEMLDLSKYCSVYVNRSNHGAMYRLFSVLVHSGTSVDNVGYCHHYMDPKVNGDWHEFCGEQVKKCTRKDAIDDNFGGIRGRFACLLVYLRLDAAGATDVCSLLSNQAPPGLQYFLIVEDVTGRVELEDIPKHLYKTLKQQKLIP